MSHIQNRRNRIASLKGTIEAAFNSGVTVDENKLVAQFCLAYGVGRSTLIEDLKLLESAGIIRRFLGEIINPLDVQRAATFDIEKIAGKFSSVQRNNVILVKETKFTLSKMLGRNPTSDELILELKGKIEEADLLDALDALQKAGEI